MRFADPQALWLLLAIPGAALLFLAAAAGRRRALARFAEPDAMERLSRSVDGARRAAKGGLALIALALGVAALARPQIGEEETTRKATGVDFYVCLDVSRSMLAPAEVDPDGAAPTAGKATASRLERAKDQLATLIKRLAGDRVGIIPFAGEAFVYCPLTLDHAIALDFLSEIDTDAINAQGTDLGNAIDTAIDAFQLVDGGAGRAIVLITDGEDQGERAVEAAQRAAANDARVYALGVGDDAPTPILMDNRRYLRDKENQMVETKLDMKTLERVANATGGLALRTRGSGVVELERVYQALRALKQAPRETKTFNVHAELFPWLLLMAFGLLGLEQLVPDRARRRQGARQGRFA